MFNTSLSYPAQISVIWMQIVFLLSFGINTEIKQNSSISNKLFYDQ